MISLFALTTIFFVVQPVSADPGKTDEDGCHFCKANCEKYGLTYGVYHCHEEAVKKPNPNSQKIPGRSLPPEQEPLPATSNPANIGSTKDPETSVTPEPIANSEPAPTTPADTLETQDSPLPDVLGMEDTSFNDQENQTPEPSRGAGLGIYSVLISLGYGGFRLIKRRLEL